VDARVGGAAQCVGGRVDVFGVSAGQTADDAAADLLPDTLHSRKVTWRGDGEPRLDDVDPHLLKEMGNLELLRDVERSTRRLLSVAQGGIEDHDTVFGSTHTLSLLLAR